MRVCTNLQLAWLLILLPALGMLVYGPISQPVGYHQFADQRLWLGLPHAADVLSNLGFLLVGAGGLWAARGMGGADRSAYRLFCVALLLTALGSSYYHFAPDNGRLLWDRLPIALACAALLARIWRQACGGQALKILLLWSLAALASVLWWWITDMAGQGDLRPYLLIQFLPMLMLPLLGWRAARPLREQRLVGVALLLYAVAKVCELQDGNLFAQLQWLSGHTLKHLLATLAAAVLVWAGLGERRVD